MATATATLTATATSAVTLSNPVSLDELQQLGTPTINISSTVPVEGLMGLAEGNYVMVEPTTTAADNGDALVAAYTTAKALSGLTATNRATVIVPPGTYTLSADLDMDTAYVDIVGLTGNPNDVFIDGASIDQRVANCNMHGLNIEVFKNDAAGAADATCVVSNCIFGTSSTQGMTVSDSFTRTFRNCFFYGAGRSASHNTLGGVLENCKFEGSNTLYIADGTVMRYCTSEVTITAAGAINAKIYLCALSTAGGIGTTVTNDIGTPYNVIDSDIAL